MPYQHTQTDLTVMARDDALNTASIIIGCRLAMLNPSATPEDIDSRYQQYKAECEADALAIFELLNSHLPEETRQELSRFYRSIGCS